MYRMSRTLGVWCQKHKLYTAVADDGTVASSSWDRVDEPAVLDTEARLPVFLDSIRRALAELKPDVVIILKPEQTYEASYNVLAPKIALETLVRLAAAEAGIPVDVLHRSTARNRIGLPQKGNFEQHVDAQVERCDPYWNAGRKLAVAAALAGPS